MLTEPSCAHPALLHNPLQTPRVAEKGGGGRGVGMMLWPPVAAALLVPVRMKPKPGVDPLGRSILPGMQNCAGEHQYTSPCSLRSGFQADTSQLLADATTRIPDTSFRYPNYYQLTPIVLYQNCTSYISSHNPTNYQLYQISTIS